MRLSTIPLLRAAVLVAAVTMAAPSMRAREIQGFESALPAGSSIGDAGTQGTFEGDAPTEGASQYLLTTISSTDGELQSPVSGSNAVAHPALQNFFGGLSLSDQEGSGVKFSFTLNPGETSISFDYDFLTNDTRTTAGGDTAFYVLYDSSNNIVGTVHTFANDTAATSVNATGLPFALESGYHTASISIASPGTYTLGIGIFDRGDTALNSGVLIDNVQTPVPEPSTLGLLLGGGLLGLVVRKRFARA